MSSRMMAFGLVIVAVAVDGGPVDGVAVLADAVAIAAVVAGVDGVVANLREAEGERLHEGKKAIKKRRTEKRVMDEVVADAVDVPADAAGVGEAHADEEPPGRAPVSEGNIEKNDERGVEEAAERRNGIPRRVGEEAGGAWFDARLRIHAMDGRRKKGGRQ